MTSKIFKLFKFPKKKLPLNQIFLIENYVSSKDCDNLIDIIDKHANLKETWDKNSNVVCDYLLVDKINNLELRDDTDFLIFKYINNFTKLLKNNYNIDSNGDSGYCLRKIYGATRFHKDGIDSSKMNHNNDSSLTKKARTMSIIIALNEDYEGGKFYFPNQDFDIKLKKGQLIAFPPYWTHVHGVEEPLNNTFRYTINTWLLE